jgi:hypothetical protein
MGGRRAYEKKGTHVSSRTAKKGTIYDNMGGNLRDCIVVYDPLKKWQIRDEELCAAAILTVNQ